MHDVNTRRWTSLRQSIMPSNGFFILLSFVCMFSVGSAFLEDKDEFVLPELSLAGFSADSRPCTCGVFLTSQINPGTKDEPRGHAVLLHEQTETSACNPLGNKHCINRCLDQVVKYLPKSGEILCAAVEEDVYRERAYLFIKNCDDRWIPTNMSAGREFCCQDNKPVKCNQYVHKSSQADS